MAVEETQEEIELREELAEILFEQARAGDKNIEATIREWKAKTKLGNVVEGLEKSVKSATKGIKTSAKDIAGSTGNLNDLSGAIGGAIGAITGLITAIPGVNQLAGPLIEKLGAGAEELITFTVQQTQAGFDGFQQLSKAGLIGAEGISGMTRALDEAGVPLATYTKVLTEHSENLAYFGGTAREGAKSFNKMLKDMKEGNDNQLRNLGYSLEEIAETSISFQKRSQRLGFGQEMSASGLAKATTAYGKELDLIAKLTGKQRSRIEEERDRLMADHQFRSLIATMPDIDVEQATRMMDGLNQFPAEVSAGLKQLYASGGIIGPDAEALGVQGVADDLLRYRDEFLSGEMSIAKLQRVVIQAFKDNEHRFADLGRITGEQVTINQAVISDMSDQQKLTKRMEAEALNTQKAQMAGADEATTNITDAMKNLQQMSATITDLTASTKVGTGALKLFADGLNEATQIVAGALGAETAETRRKANQKAAEEIAAAKSLGVDVGPGRTGKITAKDQEVPELIDKLEKLRSEQRERRSSTTAQMQELIRVNRELNDKMVGVGTILERNFKDLSIYERFAINSELGIDKATPAQAELISDAIEAALASGDITQEKNWFGQTVVTASDNFRKTIERIEASDIIPNKAQTGTSNTPSANNAMADFDRGQTNNRQVPPTAAEAETIKTLKSMETSLGRIARSSQVTADKRQE